MATKQVSLPTSLVAAIDALVGKRDRRTFLIEAAEREIERVRFNNAIDRAAGSWKDQDHPELQQGAARWVRQMRSGSDVARSKR